MRNAVWGLVCGYWSFRLCQAIAVLTIMASNALFRPPIPRMHQNDPYFYKHSSHTYHKQYDRLLAIIFSKMDI